MRFFALYFVQLVLVTSLGIQVVDEDQIAGSGCNDGNSSKRVSDIA